jgi:hypothetical protein
MRPLSRRAAACFLVASAFAACVGPSSSAPPRSAVSEKPSPEQERAHVADFAVLEVEELEWLEAADPRIALRVGHAAPAKVVEKVGTIGVLAEDTDAHIRGEALDLFAFRTRARVLDHAARAVKDFAEPLPETGPVASLLTRPRLERELLARLVDEEIARAEDEAHLGDASSELVRAMVATWVPPATPQEWPDRDAWVSKRLLQIRASLRSPSVGLMPTDLDVALYPLERLLAPTEFPRSSAAIAEVRTALDSDMRAVPKLGTPDRLARDVAKHLGVTVDVEQLPQRLAELRGRLRLFATKALEASGAGRATLEARATELLMVERPCPAVADSPVRAMEPPP